jgi:hypothetical protein
MKDIHILVFFWLFLVLQMLPHSYGQTTTILRERNVYFQSLTSDAGAEFVIVAYASSGTVALGISNSNTTVTKPLLAYSAGQLLIMGGNFSFYDAAKCSATVEFAPHIQLSLVRLYMNCTNGGAFWSFIRPNFYAYVAYDNGRNVAISRLSIPLRIVTPC